MFDEKSVKALLRDGSPWRIVAFEEVSSTMDVARREAEGGCAEFLAVVANTQTSGSGRFDRPWHSPSGNGLWMTVILRPTIPSQRAPWFTLAAAVSVAEALSSLGYPVGIKWPNDVLAASEELWRRKLCGIRAETSIGDDGLAWMNIGIGLNIADQVFPPDLEHCAASLEQLSGGEHISRGLCAAAILDRLEMNYLILQAGSYARMRDAWLSFALGLGEKVVLQDVDGKRCGIAVGLDLDGCLLVQDVPGAKPRPVLSGDLIFRV